MIPFLKKTAGAVCKSSDEAAKRALKIARSTNERLPDREEIAKQVREAIAFIDQNYASQIDTIKRELKISKKEVASLIFLSIVSGGTYDEIILATFAPKALAVVTKIGIEAAENSKIAPIVRICKNPYVKGIIFKLLKKYVAGKKE